MRKLLTLLLILSSLLGRAATDDPVLMTIAGKDITRSEFEYSYNKNNTSATVDRKDIEAYVDLFVNYKLKVKAAEDAGYDTLASFRKEFRTYRDQQIRPLINVAEAEERACREQYDGTVKSLAGRQLCLVAHIFVRLKQKTTAEEQAQAKATADSIYNRLMLGDDFATLAKAHSEDLQSKARGGELGWFGPGQLVQEMEDVMYALDKGEISKPLLSAAGYHIVRLNDKKDLEPYEKLRPQILRFLQSRGLRERLVTEVVDSAAGRLGITPEEVMDLEAERLCQKSSELRNLVQEYHDGLLLYEICKERVWDPAALDTAGMKKHHKKNRKRMKWAKKFEDAMADVAPAYQRYCDDLFAQELRKRYAVEVDKEVLGTVNKH